MKKWFGLVALIVLLVGCGSDSFSEELYGDTMQALSEINHSVNVNEPIREEKVGLFDLYNETYSSGLNKSEQEVVDKLNEVKRLYDIHYGDEPALHSEIVSTDDYETAYRELYDMLREIKEKNNF